MKNKREKGFSLQRLSTVGKKERVDVNGQEYTLSNVLIPDHLFKAKVVSLILSRNNEEALQLLSQHYKVVKPNLKVGMPKRHSKKPACYVAKKRTIHVFKREVLRNPHVILHEFYHLWKNTWLVARAIPHNNAPLTLILDGSTFFCHHNTLLVGFSTNRKQNRKEYGEATLALHREIKQAVNDIVNENKVGCAIVSSIEKKVGRDPRTVRFHLKLLEEADYGTISKDGKLFCPKKSGEKKST